MYYSAILYYVMMNNDQLLLLYVYDAVKERIAHFINGTNVSFFPNVPHFYAHRDFSYGNMIYHISHMYCMYNSLFLMFLLGRFDIHLLEDALF